MKTNHMKKLLAGCLLIGQLFTFPTAFAKSGGAIAGGGGDVVIYKDPNGNIVNVGLADRYEAGMAILGVPLKLSDDASNALFDELIGVRRIFDALSFLKGQAAFFINNAVLSKAIQYFAVEEIPNIPGCRERLTYANLPDQSEVSQVACTVDQKTWIIQSLFQKLSAQDQALLLVHEGLRRHPLKISDTMIAEITSNLGVALKLRDRQLAGDRALLSDNEIAAIGTLFKSIYRSGLDGGTPLEISHLNDWFDSFEVHPAGGAIRKKYQYFNAYVGISVRVAEESKISKGAELVETNFCATEKCNVATNSKIINSYFYSSENIKTTALIANDVTIKNSTIMNYALDLSSGAKILDSDLQSAFFLPVFRSSIRAFRLKLGKNAMVSNSKIYVGGGLVLNDGAALSGISSSGSSLAVLGNPRYSDLIVDTVIDLDNKIVCHRWNEFIPNFMQSLHKIRSTEDLIDLCRKN